MPSRNRPRRLVKWLLRIVAGVYLGVSISLLINGDVDYWTWRSIWLGAFVILLVVARYEYKDRDKFDDDFFGGSDDDDPRGPHGYA